MYGAIIYQKAPVVMRHLEALLGEDNFRDGLRDYLKAHAFANATWSDLIAVLDARTPIDLQEWSRAWVDQPGRPDDRNAARDHATARSPGWRSARAIRSAASWCGRSSCASRSAPRTRRQTLNVDLSGRRDRGAAGRGMPAPLYVLPNGGGWGYGDFRLDPSRATTC